MTYALDNLVVIAPVSSSHDQLDDWLAQLALVAKLRPLQDQAPAFSQRPLSVNVSLNRPAVSTSQGATWPEIVSGAGAMVGAVERGLSSALVSGAAVWLEATAEHAIAASFASLSFGGEQAISVMVLDLTPGAVLKFLQPLGRQALKRVRAGFEGSGVTPYFVARERSSGEALLALDAPVILDLPSLARNVPRVGANRQEVLDLGAFASSPPPATRLIDPLCERILELCDLRTRGPVRVTVKGTQEQIARAGAYLEDLARSRITLCLEPTHAQSQGIDLGALRASPILDAAFNANIVSGVDSNPDAMDLRQIRESSLPERWAMELSRRLVDQIGHGLKDVRLDYQLIQLDIRP